MATTRRCKRHTSRHQNMQSFSGSVIDLTEDSPVNQLYPVPIAEQTSTNHTLICLDDSIDVSSPVKQARVEDCAEKKSAKKKSCKKKLSESFFCPVCLEGLKFHNPAPEEQVMSTQCGHMFCYSCIVATLNERKECPLCRKRQTVRNIHPLYV